MTTTTASRCFRTALEAGESMVGTAPTETSYLFVEDDGPWGRHAVAESRLPPEVRGHLAGLAEVRVQLVRRHGGRSAPGTRVFAAILGDRPRVTTAVLDDVRGLPRLRPEDLTPYDGPLWLVCTNGRRDRCCAEAGRPVAAALAEHWPEETWETTHLGGHRFAATLLALPGGITLGRLTPETAVEECRQLERGRVPSRHVRGRAGRTGPAQVAELHVRSRLGLPGDADVRVTGIDGDRVRLVAGGVAHEVLVRPTLGEPHKQSCGDGPAKSAPVYEVTAWGTNDVATR